ncbi:putative quinol monooxygenase [Duganella callida]|uniref:Antibiotic biosynthesis monooxygenase n=1 Tax=Duganella callida TaxID=2561932 RepID=A0A4Y9S9S2_9BURK|nr:putative quinol monooxygenase [Duganella callida]TFW16868.1 antibiotic biosynthesis monooxygenase [Duganella callida]
MSAGEITVVARWQPADGQHDEVRAILAELRPASLAEPGCLGYEVYLAVDAPYCLLLIERYRDQAAIEAHRQSAHYQALVVQRALPLLADRKVELLQAQA